MKKKPTKKEINSDMGDIRKVLSSLIQEVALLRATINSYIEFKGDRDKWIECVKKQTTETKKKEKKHEPMRTK